ncbi:MAG TPA: nuclear transport factor 2 family protein [Solirubrobacteraceae bacterium]|nr:nuclear transport factor 2 family protein [Solirubrobacteraceae bacterium]
MAESANLNLVRQIYAAWERRDYVWTDWAHPEIDFEVVGGPAPGHWRGLAGMWEGWREILSAWDDWRVEEIEYRELDGERVLTLVGFGGRGKLSGMDAAALHGRGANLLYLHDGVVTRFVAYWDRERALADLGLERDGRIERQTNSIDIDEARAAAERLAEERH